MLRILIWRLGYDFCNLRGAVSSKKKKIWYFAYGANVDAAVMRRRGISVYASTVVGLPNFELRFDHPGPWEGMGYASIHPCRGSFVWGKAYLIAHTDLARLDYDELVPFFRRYVRIQVPHDGRELHLYRSNVSVEGLRPTDEYVDCLLRGLAGKSAVPRSYIALLRNVPRVGVKRPSRNSCYFVKRMKQYPPSVQAAAALYERIAVRLLFAVAEFSPVDRIFRGSIERGRCA
jgi:hypothetical protein